MKKIISFCFLFAFVASAFAQKETFDLVSYAAPKGWDKKPTDNIITYSSIDIINKTWCQINIIRSTNSKGSIEQDFESEWQEFVVKNFKPTGTPQLDEVQEADGWKIKSGATTFSFNNAEAIAMLRTMSGFDRCVSIVLTTNSVDYLKTLETFLTTIELKKPDAQILDKPISNSNVSVVGTWGFGNNALMANPRFGPWYYTKQQYSFNADGTYNFTRKTYGQYDRETLFTRETGTYSINGTTLSIVPKKNVIEAWSRPNSGDNYTKLLSSQSQPIEKTSYNFYIYYDEFLKITALMLQTPTETNRDGRYNADVNSSRMWRYLQAPGFVVIKLPGE